MKLWLGLCVPLLVAWLTAGCTPVVEQPNSTSAAVQPAPGQTPTLTAPSPAIPAAPTLSPTATRPSEATATVSPAPAASPTLAASPTPAVSLSPTLPAAAPSPAPTAHPVPVNNPAPSENDVAVYRRLYCGICHRLDAAGTTGMFGPEHNHAGGLAEQRLQDPDYTGQATSAAEYLRESILQPEAYLTPGYERTAHPMPAFTHLSEGDLNALVKLLLQQK